MFNIGLLKEKLMRIKTNLSSIFAINFSFFLVSNSIILFFSFLTYYYATKKIEQNYFSSAAVYSRKRVSYKVKNYNQLLDITNYKLNKDDRINYIQIFAILDKILKDPLKANKKV